MNYLKTIKDFENNYDRKKTRRLKDMSRYYKFDKKDENKIVYEVFTKSHSPFNLDLTVINPGTVNKEYYMTSGHVHGNKIPEFYTLLDGEGILFIQKGTKTKTKTINLKKGKLEYVPDGYAHRLINNTNNKLKVLTVYHENVNSNYNVKFKKRFFKR